MNSHVTIRKYVLFGTGAALLIAALFLDWIPRCSRMKAPLLLPLLLGLKMLIAAWIARGIELIATGILSESPMPWFARPWAFLLLLGVLVPAAIMLALFDPTRTHAPTQDLWSYDTLTFLGMMLIAIPIMASCGKGDSLRSPYSARHVNKPQQQLLSNKRLENRVPTLPSRGRKLMNRILEDLSRPESTSRAGGLQEPDRDEKTQR